MSLSEVHHTPGQVDAGVEAEAVSLLGADDLVLREAPGGTLKWHER